jgi:hypothetical protein
MNDSLIRTAQGTGNPLVAQFMGIEPGICHAITRGWIWYCDEHQDHGTGDEEKEAKTVAKAHVKYRSKPIFDEEEQEWFDPEPCEIIVFEVLPKTRIM